MVAGAQVSEVETSGMDFESEQSIAAGPRQPTINRTVKKAPKKRTAVTMKKTRAPSATKAAREALKDRTNVVENEIAEDIAPKKNARKASTKLDKEDTEPPAKKARVTSVAQPRVVSSAKPRAVSVEVMEIPETQQPIEISEVVEEVPESPVVEPQVKFSTERAATYDRSASYQRQAPAYTMPSRARSTSAQPRTFSREGSATLGDRRLADGEARRKLAEMTSKYEDMRLRYESLSELGTSAADSNFDKLKRATDQRAKDASDLIASLKKDLSEARKSTSTNKSDSARLQTQLAAAQADREQAQSDLQTTQTSLSAAQNEIKALTTKLEAARDAARKAAAAEAAKTPGSVVKPRSGAHLTGNLDGPKQAALKEELYRDLTGLIINSVKRRDGEDEFSCIQTGRNGTLHFHLSVSNDATQVNPKTPSGLSYEDAEFAYEPFFDEGRDRDLIDMLPDYLTEEICFPRGHAVKFYTKVVDSMTKKVVIED